MDLRRLTPNARALYWYFRACEGPQSAPDISRESGIPTSSVYEVAKLYPQLFTLAPGRAGVISLRSERPENAP
jgi:hypothetical protein